MMNEASYEIIGVDSKERLVYLVDLDNGRSVTNDAERVWSKVQAQHPGYRLIYRDTLGRWDEITTDSSGRIVFKYLGREWQQGMPSM